MRIHTTGGGLKTAAGWAARIVSTRPAMAVLGGVLLEAGEQCTISATDLELFGTARLDGSAIEPGRVVVSARLLANIADLIPATAEVSIERTPEGRVEIKLGRSRWGLPEIDTDNWPRQPEPGDPLGTIPAADLRRALARVLPAASTDGAVPNLIAVEFTPGETLTVVATDRYRLAVADVPNWSPKGGSTIPLTVPTGVLKPAMDALKGAGGDVTIGTDGSTVTLECGADRITGRLIANYVRWQPLIPHIADLRHAVAFADTSVLSAAVAGAAVVCGEHQAVQVTFGPDAKVHVTPETGDTARDEEADQYADLISFDGSAIAVKVTPKYVTDALAMIDEQMVEIRFQETPGRPILLRPAAPEGIVHEDYRHLLMVRKAGG